MKPNVIFVKHIVMIMFVIPFLVTCSLDSECVNTWFQDSDGDGFGNLQVSQLSCEQPPGFVINGLDLNDNDASINPNAPEIPDNDIDENGDGIFDYNLFIDNDLDNYGSSNTELIALEKIIVVLNDIPIGYAQVSGDCNDDDSSIHPGAEETLDDNIDSNCNGEDNT